MSLHQYFRFIESILSRLPASAAVLVLGCYISGGLSELLPLEGPLARAGGGIAFNPGAAMKGKVYLMEAGSGDPDLLSARAVRVLRAAEVVLHDDPVSPEILEFVPASAQVRNVHKLGLQANSLQEKVHSLLIAAARDGHYVVRLKTGDALSAAQADDETVALAEAGVDFEMIPQAGSAVGAAAGANSR